MEDKDNFKCNVCTNSYRYEGTLKTHIMVKHCKSFSYNCDQCEYHRSSVDAGVETQTPNDPVIGIKSDMQRGPESLQMECNKGKNKKSSNRTKDFGEEKSFSCKHCDTNFKSSWTLKQHLLVHTKEKPFSCEQCDTNFKSSWTLKQHLLVHTKGKPFSCNQCDFSSKRACNLKVHLGVHSKEKL